MLIYSAHVDFECGCLVTRSNPAVWAVPCFGANLATRAYALTPAEVCEGADVMLAMAYPEASKL